jgi:hypothetical protein
MVTPIDMVTDEWISCCYDEADLRGVVARLAPLPDGQVTETYTPAGVQS